MLSGLSAVLSVSEWWSKCPWHKCIGGKWREICTINANIRQQFESIRNDEGTEANGAFVGSVNTSSMSGYSPLISCNILRVYECVNLYIEDGRSKELSVVSDSTSITQNYQLFFSFLSAFSAAIGNMIILPLSFSLLCHISPKKLQHYGVMGWREMDPALSVLAVRYGQIIARSVQQRQMITGFIVSPRHNQPWFSNLTSSWFMSHTPSFSPPSTTRLPTPPPSPSFFFMCF